MSRRGAGWDLSERRTSPDERAGKHVVHPVVRVHHRPAPRGDVAAGAGRQPLARRVRRQRGGLVAGIASGRHQVELRTVRAAPLREAGTCSACRALAVVRAVPVIARPLRLGRHRPRWLAANVAVQRRRQHGVEEARAHHLIAIAGADVGALGA